MVTMGSKTFIGGTGRNRPKLEEGQPSATISDEWKEMCAEMQREKEFNNC